MDKKKTIPPVPADALSAFKSKEYEKPKFLKGDKVTFKQNKVEIETILQVVVEKQNDITGKFIDESYSYIIEHENGWAPSFIRIKKFGLDVNKKYLFISEAQIIK